jgi:hypothetical protein
MDVACGRLVFDVKLPLNASLAELGASAISLCLNGACYKSQLPSSFASPPAAGTAAYFGFDLGSGQIGVSLWNASPTACPGYSLEITSSLPGKDGDVYDVTIGSGDGGSSLISLHEVAGYTWTSMCANHPERRDCPHFNVDLCGPAGGVHDAGDDAVAHEG